MTCTHRTGFPTLAVLIQHWDYQVSNLEASRNEDDVDDQEKNVNGYLAAQLRCCIRDLEAVHAGGKLEAEIGNLVRIWFETPRKLGLPRPSATALLQSIEKLLEPHEDDPVLGREAAMEAAGIAT